MTLHLAPSHSAVVTTRLDVIAAEEDGVKGYAFLVGGVRVFVDERTADNIARFMLWTPEPEPEGEPLPTDVAPAEVKADPKPKR